MTHVAILHYTCPPVVGGVERIVAEHAGLAARGGHAVRVVAGRGGGFDPAVDVRILTGMDSRDPRVLAIKASLDRGVVPEDFERLTGDLVQALDSVLRDLDVVIAHNICSQHKNLALTAAIRRLHDRPAGPRWILWHHDLAWTSERYGSELHDGWPWNLLRSVWPCARHVAISSQRRDEAAGLFGESRDRIEVVPNGIDRDRFLGIGAGTARLVRTLGLADADPFLLAPVRVTPRKNLALSLRILAGVRRRLPEARLLVTGPLGAHNPANAAYLDELTALRNGLGLASAAHFLAGILPEPLVDAEVADLYRLADALLLPSLEEGFGLPILEAACARLPVFASAIPSLREIGQEDVTWIDPRGDPEEIAARIVTRLEADPGARLFRRVRRNHAWDRVYAAHLDRIITGKP